MKIQASSKTEKLMKEFLKELKEINKNLRKILLIIPEESLKEYKNVSEIKKALNRALKLYPPK